MKYGLILNGQIECDPVSDHTILTRKAAQMGFNLTETTFTEAVVQRIASRALWIVPGIEERPQPPAPTGYRGTLTGWQYQPSHPRLLRTITYTAMPFDDAVADTLNHIAEQQDTALARIEHGYTEQEVKTWAQQQAEAAAWTADHTASVPLIEGLALRRGVTVAVVVEKINAKVTAAATMTGIVLGDAQAAGDQINALKVQHETDTLPDDWFDQLQAMASGWRKNWPPELM
ncbi:hypothetical protein [Oceanospirillum sediminis]|uniref:Uncharacterized protein n=1 Tax=Oceanospirillum sediminis TaxID=2760088 RepID=A0A839IWP1_9GAMM|nr:hypothetical protein [Oceanospirillum sediminis]MBB1489378.1 hypothetical protein [Oceanospirillum sediminis]